MIKNISKLFINRYHGTVSTVGFCNIYIMQFLIIFLIYKSNPYKEPLYKNLLLSIIFCLEIVNILNLVLLFLYNNRRIRMGFRFKRYWILIICNFRKFQCNSINYIFDYKLMLYIANILEKVIKSKS